MALSFPRPDPSSPDAVAGASFATGRRGFDQNEVRDFLRMVAAELARLQERERYLDRELRTAQRGGPNPAIALDEEVVTRMLGEEAARILATAREAATQIKVRAEEAAARIVRDAADEGLRVREEAQVEAARRRQDAAADAESELEMAKQQGREMVNEARAYRERVLTELSRRRELARQQIEQLVHGRDRLVQAFERARLAAVDVMSELVPLGEPSEYVNLSPTTGPVPVMLPNQAPPVVRQQVEHAQANKAADVEPRMVFGVDDEPDAYDHPPEPVAEAIAAEEDVPVQTVEAEVAEVVEVVEAVEAEVVELAVVEVVEVVVEPEPDVDADAEADVDAVVEDVVDEPAREADAGADDEVDDGPRVVSLFAGEIMRDEPSAPAEAEPVEHVEPVAEEPTVAPEPPVVTVADEAVAVDTEGVDDLFARLRAARAESIAERAQMRTDDAPVAPVVAPATTDDATQMLVRPDRLSVFERSPIEPPADDEADDTPFGRRDAALTPLIVTAARKLKRVLADEQNDVLHALRRAATVTALEPMLPTAAEHAKRYADVIAPELDAAATAGAASLNDADTAVLQRRVGKASATRAAVDALVDSIVAPLRDRMARAVTDAAGDTTELAGLTRGVYRECKIQHIDEHIDEVLRIAFGHGALAGIDRGTPVHWVHDPRVAVCADCDDNSLSGVIAAGEPFATGQPCAPAHPGCRCMLATDGG